MKNYDDNHETEILRGNEFISQIDTWLNAPGDIEDFIFFDEEFSQSER